VTVTLVRARTEREATLGVPGHRRCHGLASEIALARHISPHRGAREVGLAKALVHEMPRTLAALTGGEISEWRASLVVQETAVLSREDRGNVDRELDGRLAALGDRAAAAEARKIGYRLDPGSVLRRTRGANSDRFVSLRPAPDTMTYLTGFLPVTQGVAGWLLPLRGVPGGDEADGGDAAGVVPRIAPRLPAGSFRCGLTGVGVPRRNRPADSAPRPLLPHAVRDAPVRHLDPVHARQDGGRTNETNGQGLCESCNHAKQAAV
jgi:hypothetical protein